MRFMSIGYSDHVAGTWKLVLLLAIITMACEGPASKGNISSDRADTSKLADGHNPSSSPGEVVKEFMALVEAREDAKANALFTKPESIVRGNRKGAGLVEGVPRLDWVEVLQERSFRLNKVLDETIEHDQARVRASLYREDLKGFTQDILFTLVKIEGNWLILDIVFIFSESEKTKTA